MGNLTFFDDFEHFKENLCHLNFTPDLTSSFFVFFRRTEKDGKRRKKTEKDEKRRKKTKKVEKSRKKSKKDKVWSGGALLNS